MVPRPLVIRVLVNFVPQFHRVLSGLRLDSLVDPLELQLVCQKFCIKVGGRADVSYIAFCQAVEIWSE